jgi:hypothetical protein
MNLDRPLKVLGLEGNLMNKKLRGGEVIGRKLKKEH